MKQSDLIEIIGLKSTDQKLVKYFDTYNLGKPPKSINANQMTKSIDYKPLNLSFCFSYDITNDNFQPPISIKNDSYNFVAYLSEVNFLAKDISAKKLDPKPEDFWDIHPKPINSIEVLKKTLGNPIKEMEQHANFEKTLSNEKKLFIRYNLKEQMITQCWARIQTHSEIISHLSFNKNCETLGNTVHLNTMLIKWLFENKYLMLNQQAYQEPLKNDTDVMLLFIQMHLKNHLWDNQITDTTLLRNFLFTTQQNNSGLINENREKIMFYFRDIFLKSVGRLEEFKKLYNKNFEKAEQLLGQIPFDDENYNKFSKAMTENFDLYRKLKALEISK